jgi:hypothetical protein
MEKVQKSACWKSLKKTVHPRHVLCTESFLCDAAGPRMDIVQPALRADSEVDDHNAVGFLATELEEYAHCIVKLLCMAEEQRLVMAQAARTRSLLFSCDTFRANWLRTLGQVME